MLAIQAACSPPAAAAAAAASAAPDGHSGGNEARCSLRPPAKNSVLHLGGGVADGDQVDAGDDAADALGALCLAAMCDMAPVNLLWRGGTALS